MRVTIDFVPEEEDAPEQDLLSLEISPETNISTLKEMVQAEVGIPSTSQHLYYNGHLLQDGANTIGHLNISDGDILSLHIRPLVGTTGVGENPRGQQSALRQPAGQRTSIEQDPEFVRLQLLGDPRQQEILRGRQPDLAAALDNPIRFGQIYRQLVDRDRQEQHLRSQQIARLNADPFDIEAQMRIEEMIRQEAVQENLQSAIEHNPEGKGFSSCNIPAKLI
jgi:DNA damage-inducible protein 1